ncbi:MULTISPECIES: 2-dehydro-3-deoxygalactonokinase [Ramlibacter]|uniref:2-dehydro-3-deoxygalactonokinase n=1 Tax=Ramlibacter aquaticus TaxID=2780094 RepID=A0ABR9SGR8_9BURK|nr:MULTISPECIES: 2-dehydro-3-deoxygalactonokinase [Ramlibacter]MBE7941465.1 2-dehydro-3-deoxygalactonokinase [Ramlibacter aquaticus]
MPRPLVGVDWGTSSLRVARIAVDGQALEARELPRGILTVPAGGFAAVLQAACAGWLDAPAPLVLMCGMVGSRQGWLEVPYARCPAGFEALVAGLAWPEPGRMAIVPGLRCENAGVPDVMRGEETKAFGVLRVLGLDQARVLMPGTHAKLATLADGRLQGFATCMTGEAYALLRQHSILARTLPAQDGPLHEPAFLRGLDIAHAGRGLLHAAFSARTLALFGQLDEAQGPSFLSGLLIGEELRERALQPAGPPLVLVGADALTRRYALALAHLGLPAQTAGQEATWCGLRAIADAWEAARP